MTILVAGASRGLGLAICKVGLAEGHTVIASERTETPALRDLEAENPGRLIVVQFDMTDESAIASAASRVRDERGHVTHIVNNAGVLQGRGDRATELKAEELVQSYLVHAVGPAMVVKHFLPLLRADEGIQVLNIGSESGSMTLAKRPDYAYSIGKCAVNMYTAMLRREIGSEGEEKVACIHPTWIRTDMGGSNAPGDPDEVAQRVIKILGGELRPPNGAWFFDVNLEALPL